MKRLAILVALMGFFIYYFMGLSTPPHQEIIGFWRSENTVNPSTGKYAVLTITRKKHFMQDSADTAPNVLFKKVNHTWEAKKKSWVALLETRILKSEFKILNKNALEFSQTLGARKENFGKFLRISEKEAARLLVPRQLRNYRY